MSRLLLKLLRDDSGTSAVEMGLICALIVLAMLTALKGVASENSKMWATTSAAQANAISGSSS